jgi:hypothetical protein
MVVEPFRTNFAENNLMSIKSPARISPFLAFACLALLIAAPPAKAQERTLIQKLPPMDFVVELDMKRLQKEIFPVAPGLKINFETVWLRTGATTASIDHVMLGMRNTAEGDMIPLVLVEGNFDAANLVRTNAEETVVKGTSEEAELHVSKYKSHDIFVRGVTPLTNLDYQLRRESVAALDQHVVALGPLGDIRAAVDALSGGTPISPELVQLVTSTPNSLVSFGGKLPDNFWGLMSLFEKEKDPLEVTLEAIQTMQGAILLNDGNVSLVVVLKFRSAEQARPLASVETWKTLLLDPHPKSTIWNNAVNHLDLNANGPEIKVRFTVRLADLKDLKFADDDDE